MVTTSHTNVYMEILEKTKDENIKSDSMWNP